MAELKEVIRLVENLYTVERVVAALEKEPRCYNTGEQLYTNEVHTLKEIALNEGITQKELTEKMFRTKGATSVVINKLVDKGLIRKVTDDMDARVLRLYLTSKGWEVHNCHLRYDEEKISSWMQELDFGAKEVDITNDLLERFIRFVRDKI